MTDLRQLRYGDFVFLNFDVFSQFFHFVRNFPMKLPKFNLVVHNSDQAFRIQQNNHDIVKIPLGFVDNTYKPHAVLREVAEMPSDKHVFCYLNFAIQTNPTERQLCYDTLKSAQWITCEFNIPPRDFYERIKKSKYVISPDGTGYDCHRVYESILFDTIPIIKRNPLSDFYERLPVLQIDMWTDLNEEMLRTQYDGLYKRLVEWKTTNPDWKTAKFWCK
jgi:hypothetical protein